MTREATSDAWIVDSLNLAKRAVETVLSDLHRTSDMRPAVIVDICEGNVRIAVDGNSTVPSMAAEPMDEQQALLQAAEYLQSEIADNYWEVWPLCAEHDVALRVKAHERRAWWWCVLGHHAVAPIGERSG